MRRARVAAGLIAGMALVLTAFYLSSWRFATLVDGLVRGQVTAVSWVAAGDAKIVIPGSPRLVADLYRKTQVGPLVILIHDSAPRGRRSDVARLLARRLIDRGLSVLALDLPGFGESEGFPLPLDEDFGFEGAVATAARHAINNGWGDPSQIYYFGFSLGGGVVLRASRLEPRPAAVIAVGAPCTRARYERSGEAWLRMAARQRLQDMEVFPDERSLAIMQRYVLEIDACDQIEQGALPPLQLIYGALDQDADHLRSRLRFEGLLAWMSTVPAAPHAFHIVGMPGGLVFHNGAMVDALIRAAEHRIRAEVR